MSNQLSTKTPIFTSLLVGYLSENKSTVDRVLLREPSVPNFQCVVETILWQIITNCLQSLWK